MVPQVLLSTSQFLAISVTLDNKVVNVCDVYAHTSYIQRRSLWSDALDVISAFLGPWCFIGDFNAVVGANECRSSKFQPESRPKNSKLLLIMPISFIFPQEGLLSPGLIGE